MIDRVRRRLTQAALGASACGFCAPGIGTAHSATAGSLSVWYDYNGLPGMRKVAARFTQATGVACQVEGPEDMATKFRRAATAGKGPDVFLYAHDQVGEWMGGGLLRPGLALIQRLITDGVMPTGAGYPQMEAAMAQGQVAMCINGPWAWVKRRKAGIDVDVARLPTLGGQRAVPMVGVHGAVINRSSPHRKLAAEFIENHLLTPAGLRDLNDDDPIGVPASRAFYAELQADPKLATVLAAVLAHPA